MSTVQTRPTESTAPSPLRDRSVGPRSEANDGARTAGTPEADPRVAAAVRSLAQAVRHLRTIRRSALGGNYDQPTFDRAAAACRLAEAVVRAARLEVDATRRVAGEAAAPSVTPASGRTWQRLARGLAGAWRHIQWARANAASP